VSAANLADFLVIAARLLVIKSRLLLPRADDEEEDEEEDLGEDLARQLREYKRYKQVAAELRAAEEGGYRSFARAAPPPRLERPLPPGEASVHELVAAFQRVMATHKPEAPVDEVVAPLVVHIADCIEHLRAALARRPRVRFSTLLRRTRSRLEAIVTFLALLEMIKQHEVRATQDAPFGEIVLERRVPDPDADLPPPDLSQYGETSQA